MKRGITVEPEEEKFVPFLKRLSAGTADLGGVTTKALTDRFT